jgi:hypothetical protein
MLCAKNKCIFGQDLIYLAPVDAFITVKGTSRSPIVGLHWLSPSQKVSHFLYLKKKIKTIIVQGFKFLTVSSDGLIQLWCLENEAFGISAVKIQVLFQCHNFSAKK